MYRVRAAGCRWRGAAVPFADLRHWEYRHPLCVGDAARTEPIWTGTMWEYPSFFAPGDKHMLIVSIWHAERLHYAVAMIGAYAAHRFTPEQITKLDFGDRLNSAALQDDSTNFPLRANHAINAIFATFESVRCSDLLDGSLDETPRNYDFVLQN